jgi:hypothetical protein
MVTWSRPYQGQVQGASCATTVFIVGLVRRGSLLLGTAGLFVLSVVLSFIPRLPRNSIKNFTGSPGNLQGRQQKVYCKLPGTGFGLSSGAAQYLVDFSGSQTGCTSLVCTHV